MKRLLIILAFALLAAPAFAREDLLLARITVYWPGEGQLRASSNGARLRSGHCAVDPNRIPFGSHVVFPDATCVAVDSGPAVVSRRAARLIGRNASQKNAIVIDRFFESKSAALEWECSHPHFMTVRVMSPGAMPDLNRIASAKIEKSLPATSLSVKKTAAARVDANGMQLADSSADSAISPGKRRTL